MSQNLTTDPSVEPDQLPQSAQAAAPSEVELSNPSTPQPSGFSVDNYADRLMDELFGEVEGMLDRGAKFPTEPAKPEFISLQSLAIPKMGLPSLLAPRQQPEEPVEEELDSLALATTTDDSIDRLDSQWGSSRSIDRVLLVAACASLAATAVLWFAFQNRWQQATSTNPGAIAQTDGQASSEADTAFLQYMQRSLAVIERKAEVNQQTASATTPAPALPPVGVLGNPAVSGTGSVSNGPERVYIPVYQPPQASALPGVAVAPLPTVPVAPNSTAPQSATATTPARGTIPNISSATADHVLVGLLELGGDRSAALFEVSGTTQRIHVGETVGSSGWTLVSVNNGEAAVRRNGEVRSIFVGQRF